MTIFQNLTAAIFGMAGTSLTTEEISFFTRTKPFGFILFARNCESPEQIKKLVSQLREVSGRENLPILIDQEGGRVARLKPPYFPEFPTAGAFAELARTDMEAAKKATYLNARLIAHELYNLGITVNCAPLADVPIEGSHNIIGDRAFGKTAMQVGELASCFAKGLADGGVVAVLKHIPGHGRAFADSHLELPIVETSLEILRETDFIPFKKLSHLPMAMTAHVLFTAIDAQKMATVSASAISLIRDELNFDGLLMSDDLSMKAMQGDFTQRTRDVLAAGCDVVLHCNGDMVEMLAISQGLIPLTGKSLERAEKSMLGAGKAKEFDVENARITVNSLLNI
jgi:beta-N-acetylhexosaminidase